MAFTLLHHLYKTRLHSLRRANLLPESDSGEQAVHLGKCPGALHAGDCRFGRLVSKAYAVFSVCFFLDKAPFSRK
jgi:hypothetical protein